METRPLISWRITVKKRALVFYREHRDIVQAGLFFLIAGLAYLLLVLFTPFRIPCMFHLITGFSCPGCGISRFFVEFAHLRIISVFRQNLAVGILLPVWGIIGVPEFWFNPPQLAPGSKLINMLTWFSLILVIIFGILRNIPGFEFLLPTV